MTKFNCNFLTLPTDPEPVSERYVDYFLDFDFDKWESAGRGGSFVYIDGNNRWSLTVTGQRTYGVSVVYNSKIPDQKIRDEYLSVGASDQIEKFEDVGDGVVLPVGSFLAPSVAWLAVEDFLNKPTERSSRIKWLNSRELAWPEF